MACADDISSVVEFIKRRQGSNLLPLVLALYFSDLRPEACGGPWFGLVSRRVSIQCRLLGAELKTSSLPDRTYGDDVDDERSLMG